MSAAIEALAGEVKDADAAASPGQGPAPGGQSGASLSPPLQDRSAVLGNEITGLALMLVEVLGKPFPSLKQIYTPQVTAAAGEAIARVCVKHGWLPNGLSGGYGEELAAAMILLPLAYQTYQGVTHDLARMKPRQAGEQPPVEAPAAHSEPPSQPPAAPKKTPRKPKTTRK